MRKYTKGPWDFKQGEKVCNDQKEDCLIYHKDEKGEIIHIAETFQYQSDNYNTANGTSIANACLISAAPELLEACKKIEPLLYLLEGKISETHIHEFKQAIIKAEGASND